MTRDRVGEVLFAFICPREEKDLIAEARVHKTREILKMMYFEKKIHLGKEFK